MHNLQKIYLKLNKYQGTVENGGWRNMHDFLDRPLFMNNLLFYCVFFCNVLYFLAATLSWYLLENSCFI